MARPRQTSTATARAGKLQQSLVLFHYVLSLFGCKDLKALADGLKDPALEGLDEDGSSRFYHTLCQRLYNSRLTTEQLYYYDQNIIRHTAEINAKRKERIEWKYFQYLSLLFTEIYLDRYFTNRQEFCDSLNTYLRDKFNFEPDTWHGLTDFTLDDLNKLAFWNATGSGKTLLMHINIKQYLYYAEKYHAPRLNRIIVLTPNEGLSRQHIDELQASNMPAQLFSKQGAGGFFQGQTVEVIDINKFTDDKEGEKTVHVASFEGNNLVLVDEGHKGSSGEKWLGYRSRLTEEGFSFEYSATFGQALAAKSGKDKVAMLTQYGKATLFDYSYRYFYRDGYGKDYRIMNMDDWNDDDLLSMYLTAYLLCLYEQIRIYNGDARAHSKFLIEKPLGIFVGGTVNAASKTNKREMSDVAQVLDFLQKFVANREQHATYIRRLLDSDDGIKTQSGYSIFGRSFTELKHGWLTTPDRQQYAQDIYDDLLRQVFHSSVAGARLHIDLQKGGTEEIGLRIGNADYFGVINVGYGSELAKQLAERGFLCEVKGFGTASLFADINKADSTINLLIGSKKFSEGWSSWRVSAMGLMNVGRSEGSEIIQLFGRGVRLKGYAFSLKRSNALDDYYKRETPPQGLQALETLNIFGVRADYMQAFKTYLEDEGLPTNEMDYEKIELPTMPTIKLGRERLKTIRVRTDYDFKQTTTVSLTDERIRKRVLVKLDRYPKVDMLKSDKVQMVSGAQLNTGKLEGQHLAWIDWTDVFFAIERLKNERSWYNLELSIDDLRELMEQPDWYELFIPADDLVMRDFGRDVARWQDITICLLRAYADNAYRKVKAREEQKHLEVVEVSSDTVTFPNGYTVEVRNDQEAVIQNLLLLKGAIEGGTFARTFQIDNQWFTALAFERHLYKPLLYLADRDSHNKKMYVDSVTGEPIIKISPVALNAGERTFVESLAAYYNGHPDRLAGKELYLLRNESKKGLGFFEANNFYPDFILWLKDGERQHVTFIDPKGISRLHGLDDPKIMLYQHLRDNVMPTLGCPDLTLDSFIISNTPFSKVDFWGHEQNKAQDFLDHHVLFDERRDYVAQMMDMILSE